MMRTRDCGWDADLPRLSLKVLERFETPDLWNRFPLDFRISVAVVVVIAVVVILRLSRRPFRFCPSSHILPS